MKKINPLKLDRAKVLLGEHKTFREIDVILTQEFKSSLNHLVLTQLAKGDIINSLDTIILRKLIPFFVQNDIKTEEDTFTVSEAKRLTELIVEVMQ
jgi:hypothetical protein